MTSKRLCQRRKCPSENVTFTAVWAMFTRLPALLFVHASGISAFLRKGKQQIFQSDFASLSANFFLLEMFADFIQLSQGLFGSKKMSFIVDGTRKLQIRTI
jgi:hypothetical protein